MTEPRNRKPTIDELEAHPAEPGLTGPPGSQSSARWWLWGESEVKAARDADGAWKL